MVGLPLRDATAKAAAAGWGGVVPGFAQAHRVSGATYAQCVGFIREHLASRGPGEVPLDEDVDLVEELGLASVEVMELIEELEDAFDIAFPLNDLADVRTIADLAGRVHQLAESTE